jgi:hypothetical protein
MAEGGEGSECALNEKARDLLSKLPEARARIAAQEGALRSALGRCEKQYGIPADATFQLLTDIPLAAFTPLPQASAQELPQYVSRNLRRMITGFAPSLFKRMQDGKAMLLALERARFRPG